MDESRVTPGPLIPPAENEIDCTHRSSLPVWIGLALSVFGMVGTLARGPNQSQLPNTLLMCCAFVGFGLVVWASRERRPLTRRTVLIVTGFLLAFAVIAPPTESLDVWSYTAYGRMVTTYHQSPFTHEPADYPDDPIMSRVSSMWSNTPSVYGPAWVALSIPGTALARSSALLNRLYFAVLAALAVAAALWIVDRQTGGNPLALALLGLNPFIVISVVNGAHNDAVVGLAVLGAVMLAQRHRWRWAGVLLAIAIGIKVAAGLVVLALAAWAWRWKGREAALQLVGWTAGVVAAIYAAGGGFTALAPLNHAASQISTASPWHLLDTTFPTAHAASSLGIAATLALAALLAVRYCEREHPAVPVGLAVLAYGLMAPWVLPWYLAWGFVAVALCYRSRTAVISVAVCALLTIAAIPHPHSISQHQSQPTGFRIEWQWVLPLLDIALVAAMIVWATTTLPMRLERRRIRMAREQQPGAAASGSSVNPNGLP